MSPQAVQSLIFDLILSAAETYILVLYLGSFLRRNEREGRQHWALIGAYFVFQELSYALYCPLFSTAVFYLGFAMAMALLFYRASRQRRVLVALSFVILNYACKVLSVSLSAAVNHTQLPGEPFNLVLSQVEQILACCLVVTGVLVMNQLRRMRLLARGGGETLAICLLPVAYCGLILRLFWTQKTSSGMGGVYGEVAMLLLCTTVLLFFVMGKAEQAAESRRRAVLMEQQIEMQTLYYGQMEDFYRQVQSIRHDMQNHMSALKSLIDLGQNEEASAYISKVYACIVGAKAPPITGNNMVDIVLGRKVARMGESDIAFHSDLSLPPSLPVENTDLCILVGNLMDNAIEACERITDLAQPRTITLRGALRGTNLILIAQNTFNGEVRQRGAVFETVKSDPSNSGIGLSNVRNVVEQYHGTLDITHDLQVFKVSVLLRLWEEP